MFVVSGPHYSVDLKEMRGFAIAMPDLPVIVVNGRDESQGGKAFTLIHELCHVLLGESAISNETGDYPTLEPADRRIERFCDAVAAATLMPRDLLMSFAEVAGRGYASGAMTNCGASAARSAQAVRPCCCAS